MIGRAIRPPKEEIENSWDEWYKRGACAAPIPGYPPANVDPWQKIDFIVNHYRGYNEMWQFCERRYVATTLSGYVVDNYYFPEEGKDGMLVMLTEPVKIGWDNSVAEDSQYVLFSDGEVGYTKRWRDYTGMVRVETYHWREAVPTWDVIELF